MVSKPPVDFLNPGLLSAEANIYRFNGIIWLPDGDVCSVSRESSQSIKIE